MALTRNFGTVVLAARGVGFIEPGSFHNGCIPRQTKDSRMPRLNYLQDNELGPEALEHINNAEAAGAPDPRVLRVIFRSPIGLAWYRYWLSLCNEGSCPGT